MSHLDLMVPRPGDPVTALSLAFEQLTEPVDTLALLAQRTRRAPHAQLAASAAHLLANRHAAIERGATAL